MCAQEPQSCDYPGGDGGGEKSLSKGYVFHGSIYPIFVAASFAPHG